MKAPIRKNDLIKQLECVDDNAEIIFVCDGEPFDELKFERLPDSDDGENIFESKRAIVISFD